MRGQSSPFGDVWQKIQRGIMAPRHVKTAKARMRRKLLHMRTEQSPEEASRRAGAAQRAVLALPQWQAARQVVLYVAVRGELSTDLLLRDAWASGKKVLLPRCRPQEPGLMDFVPCTDSGQLAPGSFHVPEPLKTIPPLPPESLHPQLLIAPGVGFDRRGFRLGYGGGYYDRALALPALAETLIIGLSFACQIVPVIPTETLDRPVHALCSEEGMLWL